METKETRDAGGRGRPDPRWKILIERKVGDRFCPYSLGDWLEAAARAGTPHVPARRVGCFETADLMKADWEGPHHARLPRAS